MDSRLPFSGREPATLRVSAAASQLMFTAEWAVPLRGPGSEFLLLHSQASLSWEKQKFRSAVNLDSCRSHLWYGGRAAVVPRLVYVEQI